MTKPRRFKDIQSIMEMRLVPRVLLKVAPGYNLYGLKGIHFPFVPLMNFKFRCHVIVLSKGYESSNCYHGLEILVMPVRLKYFIPQS